jgi:phosphoribosylamine---glycine ligase
MKILVLGGGGEEHAIIWKLSQSRHIDKIYCCPGNAGIAEIAECIDVNPQNVNALIDFVKYEWIDLTIVSSEEFLLKGIVNMFEREGCRVLGPNRTAAELRSSRIFLKNLLRLYRIPTAGYKIFTSYLDAEDYVRLKGAPIVIKTDGNLGGKGIVTETTVEKAIHVLGLIMKDKILGDLGRHVIIEENLVGEKVSVVFLTDGSTIKSLTSLHPYTTKDIVTRTIGSYSPAPLVTQEIEQIIMGKIMGPLLRAFISEGIKFKGILSADFIIDEKKVFLFDLNCCFKDLEAQTILPRLQTDIAEAFMAVVEEKLSEIELTWTAEPSACIMVFSTKHSDKQPHGALITGLEGGANDTFVFHEQTAFSENNIIVAGENIFSVAAFGDDINDAKQKACHAIEKIHFEGMHYIKF